MELQAFASFNSGESYKKLSDRDSYSHPTTDVPAADLRSLLLMQWKEIRNWDLFFENCYNYFVQKGIYCILLAKIFNLMTLAFIIFFSTFLTNCIDHKNISSKRTLAEALVPNCVATIGLFHWITLLIFACFWGWEFYRLIKSWENLKFMYHFYTHLLKIPDSDIQSVEWNTIVQRIVQLHSENYSSMQSTLPSRLTAHDIVNRIMRKQNYAIALFNKDLLNLKVPFPEWMFPGIGGRSMLTRVLEWNLNFCIGGFVFGESEQGKELAVKKDFLRDVQRSKLISGLKRRFIWMGIVNFIFCPFIFMFFLVYSFFKYGEEFHKNPQLISSRDYSPLALWKLRDFNELDHIFNARLNSSHPKAIKYLNQFPQQKLAIIAKFVSFVAGTLGVSLTLLSVVDDDILLNFQISNGRSVLWYLGLFGMIYTVARAFVPDPHMVYEPDSLMRAVVEDLHFLPKEWEKKGLGSNYVRKEFSSLFNMRIILTIHELLAVILTPFVLWFSLPNCAPKIVDFFREFTVHVHGVGWVCSFAVFEFGHFQESRGHTKTGKEQDADRPSILDLVPRNSNQTSDPNHISTPNTVNEVEFQQPILTAYNVTDSSKMEASVLNFKRQFPEWQPSNPEGSAILNNLLAKQIERKKFNRRPSFDNDESSSFILGQSTSSLKEDKNFLNVKGKQKADISDLDVDSNTDRSTKLHDSSIQDGLGNGMEGIRIAANYLNPLNGRPSTNYEPPFVPLTNDEDDD